MDNDKELQQLEAKLNQMQSEIKTCSDNELDRLGLETFIMLQVLHKQLGEKHAHTQSCLKLFKILQAESDKRGGRVAEPEAQKEAEVVVKAKAPKTFNELMSLGDGNAEELQMVKKT